jgi:hypothetical protein
MDNNILQEIFDGLTKIDKKISSLEQGQRETHIRLVNFEKSINERFDMADKRFDKMQAYIESLHFLINEDYEQLRRHEQLLGAYS